MSDGRKSVTILGATGSIGTSTLDLFEREPDRFRVVALTANCDVPRLAAAALRTRAEQAIVADERCLPTRLGYSGTPHTTKLEGLPLLIDKVRD